MMFTNIKLTQKSFLVKVVSEPASLADYQPHLSTDNGNAV